mmetsp:Transcript_51443/g.129895  ORF Transcript_51443/g.129895 Transcript_51443/m.129895 type:complete len:199 (+) Transcript_51443:762-1358(+)
MAQIRKHRIHTSRVVRTSSTRAKISQVAFRTRETQKLAQNKRAIQLPNKRQPKRYFPNARHNQRRHFEECSACICDRLFNDELWYWICPAFRTHPICTEIFKQCKLQQNTITVINDAESFLAVLFLHRQHLGKCHNAEQQHLDKLSKTTHGPPNQISLASPVTSGPNARIRASCAECVRNSEAQEPTTKTGDTSCMFC